MCRSAFHSLKRNLKLKVANVEFKKSGVSKLVKLCQNSKNTRINACIYNDFSFMYSNPNIKIITMNWSGKLNHIFMILSTYWLLLYIGREGYFYKLFEIDNCLVAKPIGSFFLPKRLDEILYFKESIINIYEWEAREKLVVFASFLLHGAINKTFKKN